MHTLWIEVEGKKARLAYGKQSAELPLDKKPLLWGIEKVVGNPRLLRGIRVRMREAPFSITRQVVATVSTLAWQLAVKVNGRRHMKATYHSEPNITMSRINERGYKTTKAVS